MDMLNYVTDEDVIPFVLKQHVVDIDCGEPKRGGVSSLQMGKGGKKVNVIQKAMNNLGRQHDIK